MIISNRAVEAGSFFFLQRMQELPEADTGLFTFFFLSVGRDRALLETGLATLIAGGSDG
jgi:hypothetical protein